MKLLCSLVACLLSTIVVAGLPQYLASFAADPLSSPDFRNQCATCHVNPAGGGERNEFGQAFAAANRVISVELRARFPERFRYRTQSVDAQTEIRYADPTGKTAVLKKDAQFVVIDPSAGGSAAESGNSSRAPASGSPAPQASPANARRAAMTPDWAALLPEGEGRQQTNTACTSCHNLKYIVTDRRADAAGWTVTIERMIYAHDAFVLEEEIPVIARYLAAHFGPQTPPLQLPINVNSAAVEVLRMLPGFTDQSAAQLVAARTREKISDFGKFELIVGKESAEKLRSLVSFQ